jgi:hypothetical protein
MAFSSANIQTAIIELLEGTIGSIRTITAARLKYGVFNGQPDAAKQARLLQETTGAYWFDIEFDAHERHAGTPLSIRDSTAILKQDITIRIYKHLDSSVQESNRRADNAAIQTLMDDVVQVITFPSNLTQTAAAGATGIISGLLTGPGGAGHPRMTAPTFDWVNQILEGSVQAAALIEITQAVA